ncbi:MAG: glycosyltransferase family 4 protein [Firmicutes bacterium]|nr:glycosyltransferase family 4 protein [Bacillota bacterium]
MRILILTRFYLNGQTTHVLELSHALRKKGHAVFLIISRLDHPGYAQWLKEKGIPFSRTHQPLAFLEMLQTMNFDLIHNHSSHTLDAGLQLSKRLRVPIAATCHYLDFEPLELLQRADAVVAISSEMAAQLPLVPEKLHIVENGVPIPHNIDLAWRPKHAVFLSRSSPDRAAGYHTLIDILVEDGWQVTIAGNWRHPKARSLGWVQDPYPLLKNARMVVGTGRAIREGMAAGCVGFVLGDYLDGPVTPESVSSLRNTNFSGRSRRLTPSADNLTRELAQIQDSSFPSLMRFSRTYARQYFSVDSMAAALIEIYRELVEKENHPACQIINE